MDLLVAALAALIGYLCGSISFARVIARLMKLQSDISVIEVPFPNSDEVFVSDTVSATALRVNAGAGYGCFTAILDMLKVTVPTLVFKLWQPDTPYYLIVAVFGLVGHDWPVFHGFKGGRGESPILGGLIVIDWVSVVVTNLIGWPIGMLSGNLLVLRWTWFFLLIPWFWFRTQDTAYLAYILSVHVIFWLAMRRELRQYFEFPAKGVDPSAEELADMWGMGRRFGRLLDRYSLPALIKRGRAN